MKLKPMIFLALFIAMVMAVTMVLVIPIQQGYINLSDTMIMIFSAFLPLPSAFLVGAAGCALADVALGFGHYAIFTFFIKGLEGLLIGWLIRKFSFRFKESVAFVLGALLMICGYALTDSFLASSILYFPVSFIANLPQGVGCVILASLLYPFLKPVLKSKNLIQ